MQHVTLDVKVRGDWKGTMTQPDGTERHWVGQYETIEKPNKLVMSITDTGVLTEDLEFYSLTLEDQGQKKTQMTLTQSGGNLTDEEYKHAKAGTESFMDTMEAKVLPMLKARHDAM